MLLAWSQLECNLERRGREKKGEDQKGEVSHFLSVSSSTRLNLSKLDLESDSDLIFLRLRGKDSLLSEQAWTFEGEFKCEIRNTQILVN